MIYWQMAMAALRASGLVTKLVIAAGAAAALLAGYGVWHHKVYQRGVNDTIAAIAREDNRLIKRALEARGRLGECRAAGRDWDQTTGGCR